MYNKPPQRFVILTKFVDLLKLLKEDLLIETIFVCLVFKSLATYPSIGLYGQRLKN